MKITKAISSVTTAAMVAFASIGIGSTGIPFSVDLTASAATVSDISFTGYENYTINSNETVTIPIGFKGQGIARIGGTYTNSDYSVSLSKIEWKQYPEWCLAELKIYAPSSAGDCGITLNLYDDYSNTIGTYTTNISIANTTFDFSNMVVPATITCGNWFNLGGQITCSTNLSSVSGQVIDDNSGNVVLEATSSDANDRSFDIRTSVINTRLTFGTLPVGSYTLVYKANACDGNIYTMRYQFTVKPRYSASENENIVYNFLVNEMGYSKAAAIGVIANIAAESGFNPNIYGDSGTSYGICQWHKSRFTKLKAFASKRGLDYTDINTQLKYIKYELEGTNVDRCLRTVTNDQNGAYNAAYYFCYHFERPANTRATSIQRGNNAIKIYWYRH